MITKDLEIIVDNKCRTYYAGQMVSGQIEYTVLHRPEIICGIGLTFNGKGNTAWNEMESHRENNQSNTITVPYSGHEEYFNNSLYIVGSEYGDPLKIPIGKNVYPFSCQLPFNLPSSFEGEFGYVRYDIIVNVDRPSKSDKTINSIPFTVVSHLDLNSSLEYRNPVDIELVKSLGCLCCVSGDVIINVHLPVSGYCPGQPMLFEIECENKSSTSVDEIKIYLKGTITFQSLTHSNTKQTMLDIAELSLGKVKHNTCVNWQPHLEVPAVPASNKYCAIIDVQYKIVVGCYFSGCHMDKEESSPVTIGTVPLAPHELPITAQETIQIDVPIIESYPMPYPMPTEMDSMEPSAPPPSTMYAPSYSYQNPAEIPPPSYDSVVNSTSQEKQLANDYNNETTSGHARQDVTRPYPAYGFVIPPK